LELLSAGLCRRCYYRTYRSEIYFGGHREQVLARDRGQCQSCGAAGKWLNVHHRRPGVHDAAWLITVCAACHTRIHRLQILRRWYPEALLVFWEELHPVAPRQLQFAFEEVPA
jgi:5-methylcytosine-specific restriction endonuclease McrA